MAESNNITVESAQELPVSSLNSAVNAVTSIATKDLISATPTISNARTIRDMNADYLWFVDLKDLLRARAGASEGRTTKPSEPNLTAIPKRIDTALTRPIFMTEGDMGECKIVGLDLRSREKQE